MCIVDLTSSWISIAHVSKYESARLLFHYNGVRNFDTDRTRAPSQQSGKCDHTVVHCNCAGELQRARRVLLLYPWKTYSKFCDTQKENIDHVQDSDI